MVFAKVLGDDLSYAFEIKTISVNLLYNLIPGFIRLLFLVNYSDGCFASGTKNYNTRY